MMQAKLAGPPDLLNIWNKVKDIPGWLPFPDAYVLWLMNDYQRSKGLQGRILEIGAYKGQSAALLGLSLQEGERLEVCDLFGGEAPTSLNAEENRLTYPDLDRRDFECNYAQSVGGLPIIHAVPSSELGNHLEAPSYRLMHIDGSHLYEPVQADLILSQERLGEGGLLVLDDWSHSDHPEVAAAIWEVVSPDGLVPIATTDMKMYATWSSKSSRDEVDEMRSYLSGQPEFETLTHVVRDCEFVQLRLRGWTSAESRCL
jgi:hypothetical protein